ncbi:MAG: TIGR03118 family protein [Alphaproteobacteria bacterium]|nr:TIGR03118 family protein [Alphaproteobacteria bacterium]
MTHVSHFGNASGTYDITAGDDSFITVGNGNDIINLTGGNDAFIRIGNGNDTVTATGGTDNDFRIGNGNDSVTLIGGSDNSITIGNGDDMVIATGEADDEIRAGNGNDTLVAGDHSRISARNGNDSVTAGDHAKISLGNGNDTVSAGANSKIVLGNGNDMVIVGSNSSVHAKNGNDTVAGQDGDKITLGNGNDTVSAGAHSKIVVGNGNDSVTAGAGSTVTVGNGNDTVTATAGYLQTNLVSDIANLATVTDAQLKNPWGLSHSSTSPFWISNNDSNNTTLYSVTGSTTVSKININAPIGFVALTTSAPQGPTGQVNNTNASSFLVENGGNGGSAHFIFAGMNGTISAWDAGTTAFVQATTPGACYSGLAINQAQTMLYAANNAGSGSIDVFNSSFAPVSLGAGAFATPTAIAALGLNPFNVRDIGGSVYVTYALPGNAQDTAAVGEGAVAVFNESGTLMQTMVGGVLASPWGITLAPSNFGQFSGDLLVGNESKISSEINAFNPKTGAFEGTIPINVGTGNTAGALWALDFGTGGANGSPNTLYFTDGINSQADGLFGAISAAPAITSGENITLGKGTDTVNFAPASIGNNTVNDFNPGQDTIGFNHALFANAAAVFAATTQVGHDTVIRADANDSVTLTHTLASTLSASNFHFS